MAEAKIKRFSYSARDGEGKLINGTMPAVDIGTVSRRLMAQGLAPLNIRLASGSGSKIGKKQLGPAKRVKAKDLAILSSQFATMLDAGLLLVRALQSVEGQTSHPELQRVLPLVRKSVEEGLPLSEAMAKFPYVFPALMIGMIAAGEESGHLSSSMLQIAENFEKEAKLRSKVISALMYPAVVLGITVLMLIVMLVFVVPKFTSIFASLGGTLPLPTLVLVKFSHGAKYLIPLLAAISIGLVALWRKNKFDRRLRKVVDPIKLNFPVLGSFFKKIALARFARTFASLLSSGVPLLNALDIVSVTSGNIVISDALQDVKKSVNNGQSIADTLVKYEFFPPLLTQMVAIGEETGQIPGMLNRVANHYESEVETASDGLTSIIEPIMIVFLAVVVGGMVISLYLPLFKIFTLIH